MEPYYRLLFGDFNTIMGCGVKDPLHNIWIIVQSMVTSTE